MYYLKKLFCWHEAERTNEYRIYKCKKCGARGVATTTDGFGWETDMPRMLILAIILIIAGSYIENHL